MEAHRPTWGMRATESGTKCSITSLERRGVCVECGGGGEGGDHPSL